MTWQDFYLVCFFVGLALAVLSFLSGTLHWPLHHGGLHVPHGAHLPHAPHAGGHAVGHGGQAGSQSAGASISPYNFGTMMAFLAWFGGMGYLLTTRGHLGRLVVLALATVTGLAGALILFGVLTKVLLRHERFLESADFEMVGVLGRVTVTIRPEGTGEIVYSQAGTRRSCGARSESDAAILRGTEVIVTRYERGIAYVRPFEELAGSGSDSETVGKESSDVSSAPN